MRVPAVWTLEAAALARMKTWEKFGVATLPTPSPSSFDGICSRQRKRACHDVCCASGVTSAADGRAPAVFHCHRRSVRPQFAAILRCEGIPPSARGSWLMFGVMCGIQRKASRCMGRRSSRSVRRGRHRLFGYVFPFACVELRSGGQVATACMDSDLIGGCGMEREQLCDRGRQLTRNRNQGRGRRRGYALRIDSFPR